MPESLSEISVGNIKTLIRESLKIAKKYCNLSNNQREKILKSGKNFFSIKIWSGDILIVKPVRFIPEGTDDIGDVVWVNCNQDKFALESFLSQLLEKIKPFFMTHSKNRDYNDILQWEIIKSS